MIRRIGLIVAAAGVLLAFALWAGPAQTPKTALAAIQLPERLGEFIKATDFVMSEPLVR